ncbi:tetratricopeptide repeat protein [uncultured Shimia sp.]|uniref:tetratricopeptide repeat protein n=1 Tax=uncultured Shimia sp. TaxID=573152 RepID=UPI0026319674|nr:tetratricopeptide repeat protein [uncultured Shimia sp.]
MLKKMMTLALALTFSVALAGCESAEERAQKHFEKAMALLEEGDMDRALIEFKNVFKLNGNHKEARLAYAQVQEDRGNLQQAYGQYLRLIEQYPENMDGLRALVRMSAHLNNWEEAKRHVAAAEKITPQDPLIMSVRAGVDYHDAMRSQNLEAANLVVKVSEILLQENADLPAARQVVIDDLLRRQDWVGALAAIEEGLKFSDSLNLYMLRLGVLEQLGRNDDIVVQLKDMEQKFPDAGAHQTLVGRLVAEERLDEAEAYLRERAERDDQEDATSKLELVAFLARVRDRDTAIAEIDQMLNESTEFEPLLRSIRAGLDFEAGNKDAALLEMEDVLKGLEASEEADRIKVAYAKMLVRNGNSVGARAQIEEVLEHDPSQVDAIKIKAGWLIEDDRPGDALVELRVALDQAPRDAEVMTLMANAHERTGNRDLMGEMLSLAVEASGSAPEESLRYARFLISEEKLLPAEDILKSALRLQSANPTLLFALGGLYIQMDDWARAQHVIDTLSRLGISQADAMANELTARKLAGQNQAQELDQFLTSMAEESSGLQAAASIVRLRLIQDDVDGALAYIDELSAEDQNAPALRYLRAGVLVVDGQRKEAMVILQKLAEEFPKSEQIWLALYRLHRSQGDVDAASQTLNLALTALPDSARIKWALASEAEQKGDIDGAITIYEELYAANSNNVIIANNLASLVSTYRTDNASLQRAYDIARRLRGTEVPAFQDTYGWIAHRLGNHDEALEYLEPAAKALTLDPVVQFHLAENYAARGLSAEALEQYRKVVELVEGGARRPDFMDKVEAEIARLSGEQN